MIGVFDSGIGGKTVLDAIQKLLPEYEYMYLADDANLPYGDKKNTCIKQRTEICIRELFSRGCVVVILACNTSTVHSIRYLQEKYPEKKILGVTIPGAEAVVEKKYKNITILATQKTVEHSLYEEKISQFDPSVRVQKIATPEFVEYIEFKKYEDSIDEIISEYISQISPDSEAILLGCTHYPYLIEKIKKYTNLPIINPSQESAEKFVDYLRRHPEVEEEISKKWQTHFFSTGKRENFLSLHI